MQLLVSVLTYFVTTDSWAFIKIFKVYLPIALPASKESESSEK